MKAKWTVLILASLFAVQAHTSCPSGFINKDEECVDQDECSFDNGSCGKNTKCFNTNGSYYCQCKEGYRSSPRALNFTAEKPSTCTDINECLEDKDICGPNATCQNIHGSYSCTCNVGFVSSTGVQTFIRRDNIICEDKNECKEENICGRNASCKNTKGSYYCICNAGFGLKSLNSSFTGKKEQCEDICKIERICGNGTCHHEASGHYCACFEGFTNYGNKTARCKLDCGIFKDGLNLIEKFDIVKDYMKKLNESCRKLLENEDSKELNGEDLLTSLLSIIDQLLSTGIQKDSRKVSTFLDLVEQAIRIIGPFTKTPGTERSTSHTELKLLVHTGSAIPQGLKTLSSKQAKLDIKLEEAAGDPSFYPGFTTVSLLSYANLEEYADGFFYRNENESFKINSKVVTLSVSNRDTKHLKEPVNITLYHLDQSNRASHICVYWDSSKGGAWSTRGCSVIESNQKYTMCSCNHLSSFAVLMALYEIEGHFELQLISWVGLSLSLICLFLCILTFSMIRSIKSPRTTIHLHLCISLFTATLIFLVGISRTENKVGCAVVAGMLHFFYLAAFCWMCLEGIQLFRMVVLVFNANFKTIYMMAGGYGVPAVIVAITALVNADGYGTEKYCWLHLDSIWSFFGPACVIIIVNVVFFLITVWKLAQKFSSLNPDLDSLHKIKAFTITAVAQLCVLGTMWIFGCFQFEKGTIVMSYLFTIFGSLQGVMLFVMHCLFSKQVREEYEKMFSQLCAPQKRTYSEFNFSNSSKANASRSTQDTGESHI